MTTPIAEFFVSYGFTYDPTAAVMPQFRRLCHHRRWTKKSEERRAARDELNGAIAAQFNQIYGEDVDRLAAWQDLCRDLKMDPPPATIKECRKVCCCTLHM
jgi:hypothetical protein